MPVPTNYKSHRRIIIWASLLPSAPDSIHSTPLHSLLYLSAVIICLPSFHSLWILTAAAVWFSSSGGIPNFNLFCSSCHRSAQQIDRVVSRSVYGWSWLGAPTLLRKPYFLFFSFYFILNRFKYNLHSVGHHALSGRGGDLVIYPPNGLWQGNRPMPNLHYVQSGMPIASR